MTIEEAIEKISDASKAVKDIKVDSDADASEGVKAISDAETLSPVCSLWVARQSVKQKRDAPLQRHSSKLQPHI